MRLLLIFLLLASSCFIQAQTVTGSWYGLAEPNAKGSNTNNYLTELIIKQKGNAVEGIFGYYFRSGYQSYYIHGRYNPKTRTLTIKNIPVAFYKNRDIDGIECPMDLEASLFVSKLQSKLTGAFISQEKYKYTCPQLNFNYTLDISEKNQDSLIRSNATSIKKYWKPRDEELVINTKDIPAAGHVVETIAAPAFKDSAVVVKDSVAMITDAAAVRTVVKDSVAMTPDAAVVKTPGADRKKELEKLVVDFEKRKTILKTEIEIESDSVRISFYDNGQIDGDSITVFINKMPVLTHQRLAEKALNMYIAVDSSNTSTEITMFAENLGIYPPNTALMVITDGAKRTEVFLSSSLKQNASVVLKRKTR
ncbi:MAG: hypothetical protein ABIQ88_05530 [Chitinophagaceae bacterium]